MIDYSNFGSQEEIDADSPPIMAMRPISFGEAFTPWSRKFSCYLCGLLVIPYRGNCDAECSAQLMPVEYHSDLTGRVCDWSECFQVDDIDDPVSSLGTDNNVIIHHLY